MTVEVARQLLAQARELDNAAILEGDTQKPFEVQTITLDLSTAQLETKPYKIGFPFRSLYVTDATDNNVSLAIKLNTDDSFQSAITVRKNSGLKFPKSISSASLSWSAQASKSITIIFFVSGEYDSGQLISTNSGGINLNYGDTATPQTSGTIATSATLLFASDSSRKMMTIQNLDIIPVWIGGDNTITTDAGTKMGIKLNPGDYYEWLTTAACYEIGNSAGTANKIGLNKFS